MIYEIINKHCAGIEVECKDFVLPCYIPSDLSKKVKTNTESSNIKSPLMETTKGKASKNIKTKSEDVTVSIPAEVFFTDPNYSVYKKENQDNIIKNVYISISVDQLLSRAQKLVLDPLVIKIIKLNNVPVDTLNEIGYVHKFFSFIINIYYLNNF